MAAIVLATQTREQSAWIADQTVVGDIVADFPNETEVPGLVTIPDTGIVRVRVEGHTHNGDSYTNTFHMVYNSQGVGVTGKSAELMIDLVAWVAASFGTWVAQAVVDWGLDAIKAYVYDAINDQWPIVGEATLTETGTNVTYDPLPAQIASKVKVVTGITGIRGGIAFGAFNENHNGADGEVRTTVLSDLADLYELMYEPFVGTDWDLYPGVWSPTQVLFGVARFIAVNNVWDGIYKRKFGVGN